MTIFWIELENFAKFYSNILFVSISFINFISFPGILAFDEKNNEASMSNIVMLHLTSNGDYSTSNKLLNQQPLNHPVKSSMTGRLDIIIGTVYKT